MRTGTKGFIQKRGKYFYLQISHRGTRRLRAIKDDRSESVTTREAAEKYRQKTADAIIAQLSGHGDLPLNRIYDTYLEHLPNYQKKGKRHVDASKSIPIAPATLHSNKIALDMFIGFLHEKNKGAKTTADITPTLAKLFIASLRKKDFKESSINRYLMAVRSVFNVLPQTEQSNPFKEIKIAGIEVVAEDEDKKKRFEIEELQIIYERARERKDWIYLAVIIGYHTALRLGDILNLRWKNIDDEGYVNCETRKSRKEYLEYHPEILAALSEWRETFNNAISPEDYIFPIQAESYRKDRSAPVKLFQKFLKNDCRIVTQQQTKGKDGKPLTNQEGKPIYGGQALKGFHSLRVSNATYGRLAGQSKEEIQKRLAHTDKKTTAGYIQETLEEKKKELRDSYKPMPKLLEATEAIAGTIDIIPATDPQDMETRLRKAIELIKSGNMDAELKRQILSTLEP